MINISRDDVLHLARLSSLQLTDEEVASLQEQLANIVTYIGHLEELDTSSVEPSYQVTDLENTFRDDVIDTYNIESDTLVALAPESDRHQIKVPKVLDR